MAMGEAGDWHNAYYRLIHKARGKAMRNLARRYGWDNKTPHTQSYLETEICKIIQSQNPRSICDIGCGNGAMLKKINSLGNFRLYGIEVDREGSRIASNQCPEARILNISTEDDPPAELANIDLAISTEVIEHLFRPASLLEFAHKILAPSGRIIISTPYHGYIKNLTISLANGWDKHFSVSWTGGHIKFFSRTTLEDMLSQNGFTPESFAGAGRLPYLWKSMIITARSQGSD